jgi:hypothetical protein
MELFVHASEAQRHYIARQQDLNFRRIERMWRRVDDTRRLVDKKTIQLQALASLSALTAGFEMVVLVETNLDPKLSNEVLLTLYAASTAATVGLMLLVTAASSLLLVRILNFDEKRAVLHQHQVDFATFWESRCATEWKVCMSLFLWGFPMFFLSLGLMSWLRFSQSLAAAVVTSVVAFLAMVTLRMCTGHHFGVTGFIGASNPRGLGVADEEAPLDAQEERPAAAAAMPEKAVPHDDEGEGDDDDVVVHLPHDDCKRPPPFHDAALHRTTARDSQDDVLGAHAWIPPSPGGHMDYDAREGGDYV